jgi:uncharacterized protein YjbI with pentapeptide repeats
MGKNFAGQNLQGQSLRGQNLAGANFSGAKVLDVDFTKANLTGANFSRAQAAGANFTNADVRGAKFHHSDLSHASFYHARTGIADLWGLGLLGVCFGFAVLTGILSCGVLTILDWVEAGNVSWGIVLATLGVFLFYALRYPWWQALIVEAGCCLAALGCAWGARLASPLVASTTANAPQLRDLAETATSVLFAIGLTGAIAWLVAVAVLSAAAIGLAGIISGVLGMIVFIFVAFLVAQVLAGGLAMAFALTATCLGAILAWRAIAGDPPLHLIRSLIIRGITFGGTSFLAANLSGANFTYSTLKGSDFQDANLQHVIWYRSFGSDESRVNDYRLKHPKLRGLAVTRRGIRGNFASMRLDGMNLEQADLRYANLERANLESAILRRANLRGANLRGANLRNADLEDAKTEQADFTNAKLDGAVLT